MLDSSCSIHHAHTSRLGDMHTIALFVIVGGGSSFCCRQSILQDLGAGVFKKILHECTFCVHLV